MANKNSKVPLYNVLNEDESIFFEGRPNKVAYVLNSCKEDIYKFLLDILFKCVLIPVLFFNVISKLNTVTIIFLVVIWALYLIPTLLMFKIPFEKAKECKNTYYIVTDKAIYIQFGVKQIYYRIYPNDRIGTRVFYRANKIDTMFGVGTLGFSVDDYYEERFSSIKDYESLYNVLRDVTNSRKEELQRIQEERQAKKRELEEQAKLVIQEEKFLRQQEEDEEKRRRERYEREVQERLEREREEHERYLREREERQRREEENRRRIEEEQEERIREIRERHRRLEDDDDDDDDDDDVDVTDSYDMYGVETEDRPPSEKTVNNYRNRYSPSMAAHRRFGAKRPDKRTIKRDANDAAPAETKNDVLNMNRLWSSNTDDDDEE